MSDLQKSGARLDFRLPSSAKEIIEQAAVVSGQTVSDFAVTTLVKSAQEVLERQKLRQLSDRDREIFLQLLDQPPRPNAALRRAAARYKKQRARK
jgi:uncharacterized protein (DUF1778 family)